jgi:hypothetical protein
MFKVPVIIIEFILRNDSFTFAEKGKVGVSPLTKSMGEHPF